MLNDKAVSKHYIHGDLLNAIQSSIAKLGIATDNVTVEDLAPVDEFHIGGRQASETFLAQLNFTENKHVLDVGCGLGGTSRFVASRYKSRVSGIDLAQEYIDTGKMLSAWVQLDKQINLYQGSALSMPFQDESFDGGFMIHVGMNIKDKARLFSEIYRVLKPGSGFGVYDIMKDKEGELTYPVPWAGDDSTSILHTADEYKKILGQAGFEIIKENNRRDFALDFFKKLTAKNKANGGPPPLGLHTLMKESTPLKLKNMINNIKANYIAPVEIFAKKNI